MTPSSALSRLALWPLVPKQYLSNCLPIFDNFGYCFIVRSNEKWSCEVESIKIISRNYNIDFKSFYILTVIILIWWFFFNNTRMGDSFSLRHNSTFFKRQVGHPLNFAFIHFIHRGYRFNHCSIPLQSLCEARRL
jgi:hypothetical protein